MGHMRNTFTMSENKSCYICLDENDYKFVAPCNCEGDLKYVHEDCIEKWILTHETDTCRICSSEYLTKYKSKLLNKGRMKDLGLILTIVLFVILTLLFFSYLLALCIAYLLHSE